MRAHVSETHVEGRAGEFAANQGGRRERLAQTAAGGLGAQEGGGRVYCYLAERKADKVVFSYLGKLPAGEIRRYEEAKKRRADYRRQIRDLKQQIRYLEKATRLRL